MAIITPQQDLAVAKECIERQKTSFNVLAILSSRDEHRARRMTLPTLTEFVDSIQ